jgi:phenylacetate-CoA ligase
MPPAPEHPNLNVAQSRLLKEPFFDREQLSALQLEKLQRLAVSILPNNQFYAGKWREAGADIGVFDSLDGLQRLPFTTKDEILADQSAHPPYGTNLTFPVGEYVRVHQSSGTSARPLRWLDTKQSWSWLLDCWELIFSAIGLRADDRLFFPFSFGPFLGFWGAFEGAARLGNFCLPGGGMSSTGRLQFIRDHAITIVACTPTYALRLAEVAKTEGVDLAGSCVRALIVAGEPGGSIPATRARIERAWGARVFDHTGMTEIGATGIECREAPGGVHLLESEFIAESIDPATTEPVAEGEQGELVLTNLGRLGSPLVRYRTGDLVRLSRTRCACGRSLVRMEGGILGRTDDMLLIRGNNVYPSSIEAVIRRFEQVAEYRVEVDQSNDLAKIRIDVEPVPARETEPSHPGAEESLAARISRAIHDTLLFRPQVSVVPPGTLERFEMKARRFVKGERRG